MCISTISVAQLSLSFNAGVNHHKTTIGYKTGNFVPYIGFEAYRGKVSFEGVYDREKYSGSGSVSVFMPNLGLKAFLIKKESIKGGVNIGVYKPFISGKAEDNGKEIKEFSEQFDNFSSFGGDLSFFSEYFFTEQFSIGGEFGYRFASFKVTNPDDSNEFGKLSLRGTYSSFSLNYYF